MDLNQASDTDLESLLRGAPLSSSDSVSAWISDVRLMPGKRPALPATEMWVLYRTWCQERGHGHLDPFPFVRRIRMVLGPKRGSRMPGSKVRRCYTTTGESATLLRKLSAANPPTDADHEKFKFRNLKTNQKDSR